jgi:glycine/D-amino acid oxidase-like deaminating enzyme
MVPGDSTAVTITDNFNQHRVQHTGSYYAATINNPTDYAALCGDQQADVCVIGAGFTGISTALHLAERGYNVHVVEANKVGWGASGRNGGQLIHGIPGEAAIAKNQGKEVETVFADLRWAGHEIVRQRVEKYSIDCDLKFGYIDVATRRRHLLGFEQELARLQARRFPHEVRLLDAADTAELIGSDAYLGGLINMGNGHLHPLNLCIGEARAAESLGATLYEQSPVLRIEHGPKAKVVTASGSVTADAVVIAGNAYHLLEDKLRGIMFPVNSYIIATEALPADLAASINPQDLAICDQNFAVQYFRLSADRRLLFGARANYFGHDPNVIKQSHIPKMLRVYPQLQKSRIDFAWGGTIGVPVNRVPLLGRTADNVFYCQGYSGHGVNTTHLAGQIMADAIAGTLERFDLFASVKPVIIPGAHTLRRPLVYLGMLYYRIRDRL